MRKFCLMLILTGFVLGRGLPAAAEDPVCATVKIEIKQELTLERQAFDAHMRINNGLSHLSLENVGVVVTFEDEAGNNVEASSDPNSTTAAFFIRVDTMDNINDVSGAGVVAPDTSADIHWLIVPAPGSANENPQGTLYYVGASLSYTMGGEEHVTEVTPDYIYVKPMPKLILDYFLPKEVHGDDAFTPAVEPAIPFPLAVRVKNAGFGHAQKLKIDSAQPKIIDNDQGLLAGFHIQGCDVNGIYTANSLLADFGVIPSGQSGVARWIMTCSLSGLFVEFSARYSHADELGGELTSLIEEVNTHTLIKDVLLDAPGQDFVPDLLADDEGEIRLYDSENLDATVANQSVHADLVPQNGDVYVLTAPVTPGYMYVTLPDPLFGTKALASVLRSDGKHIRLDNAWLSKSRNASNEWEYFVNLFDSSTTGQYTFVFGDPDAGNQPPVMQVVNDQSVSETQSLSFSVQAADPDGTIPLLSASPLPAGAVFTDQGDGTGMFDWTPALGQAGQYALTFTASDNDKQAQRPCTISVFPYGDIDGDGLPDEWEMAWFGSLAEDSTGDYDNDGAVNLAEYERNTNPVSGRPPSAPVVVSPIEGGAVNTLTPVLSVGQSIDDEAQPVLYDFEIYEDASYSMLVASQTNVAEIQGTASWEPAVGLKDKTRYHWRARATDGGEYGFWTYADFFVNADNSASPGIKAFYPADSAEVNALTLALEAVTAQDPAHAPLVYSFALYEDEALSVLMSSGPAILSGPNGIVQWSVPVTLADHTAYYWQVTGTDSRQNIYLSDAFSFTVNTSAPNQAPSVPVCKYPGDKTWQETLRPVLSVHEVQDPDKDAIVYVFEISVSSDMAGVISSIETENTSWHVDPDLADTDWYYWRVKARDSHGLESGWSAVSCFYVRDDAQDMAPALSFVEPSAPVFAGTDRVELKWQDTDPDSAAMISLYYDTDAAGADGVLMAHGIQEDADGFYDLFDWDITAVDEGTYYIYAVITDESSEVVVYADHPVTIDRTAPVVVPDPLGGIYLDAVDVSLFSGEPGVIHYTLDGTMPDESSPVYETPLPVEETTVLSFYAQDLAGNASSVISEEFIVLDESDTNVHLTDLPDWSADNTPAWSWSAPMSGPPVLGYVYSLDNGPEVFTADTAYEAAALSDGTHVFSVKVRYDADPPVHGHPNQDSFGIDTTPPVLYQVELNNGSMGTDNAQISVGLLHNNDNNASGITGFEARIDNGAFLVFDGQSLVLPNTLGPHTVQVRLTDAMGFVSDPQSAMIVLSPKVHQVSGTSFTGELAVLKDLRTSLTAVAPVSNEDFVFHNIPSGLYGLYVQNNTSARPYQGRISLMQGRPFHAGAIEPGALSGSVTGLVNPGLSEVKVSAGLNLGQGAFFEIARTRTLTNGSYSLAGLHPGQYLLKVQPDPVTGYGQTWRMIDISTTSVVQADFDLPAAVRVSGLCTHADVFLKAMSPAGVFARFWVQNTGQYEVGLSSGMHSLFGRTSAFRLDPVAVTVGEAPVVQDLALAPVTAADQGHLAGSALILEQDKEQGINKSFRVSGFSAGDPDTLVPLVIPASQEIMHVSTGSFSLFSHVPAQDRLLCVLSDDQKKDIHAVNIAPYTESNHTDFVVTGPGAKIQGRVAAHDSRDVQNSVVILLNEAGRVLGMCEGASHEYFFKNIGAGQTYTLRAIDPVTGHMGEIGPLTLQEGDDLTGQDIVVHPPVPVISITGIAGDNEELGVLEYWNDKPMVVSFDVEAMSGVELSCNIGDLDADNKTVTIPAGTQWGDTTVTVTAQYPGGSAATASVEIHFVVRLPGCNLRIIPRTLFVFPWVRFAAFVRLPSLYDVENISWVTCDGAPAVRARISRRCNRAVFIFRVSDITELPIDKHFVLRGAVEHNGKTVIFQGSDDIRRVIKWW